MHQPAREQEHGQARMATISKALKQAAAYLPAGRAILEAEAERRALEAEIFRPSANNRHRQVGHETKAQNARFRRLQLQIYDANKALGMTSCLGPRPPAPGAG
jgi:hypothetical protein